MEVASLNPERQKRAKVYARIQRRLTLVDLAIGTLYVIAWLALGWSGALKTYLLGWTTNDWLLVAAYGVVFGAGIYVLLQIVHLIVERGRRSLKSAPEVPSDADRTVPG